MVKVFAAVIKKHVALNPRDAVVLLNETVNPPLCTLDPTLVHFTLVIHVV